MYMAHAPSGIAFAFWFVVYLFVIPLAFLLWLWTYREYFRKGQYRLKELGIYLILGLFVTSVASFNLSHMYIYMHSTDSTGICFTASCIISDPLLKHYDLPADSIKKAGVPSIGLMKGYWMYDRMPQVNPAIPVNVREFVIIRTVPFLPYTQVTMYHIENGRLTGKKTIGIAWPMQPGKRLTDETNWRFTVIVGTSGGGPGA